VEYVPAIEAETSACPAEVRSRAERALVASSEGCVAGVRPPSAPPDGAVEGVVVGDGDSVRVGVGVGSVDGEGVGVIVGVASIKGSVVGVGSVGEGSGVGLESVGERSAGGGGVSVAVGGGVSVGAGDVSLGVGSAVGSAAARPPSAEPNAAVAATTAMMPARRRTGVAQCRTAAIRREPALNGRDGGLGADPTFLITLRGGMEPAWRILSTSGDSARNVPGRRGERPTNRAPPMRTLFPPSSLGWRPVPE
jgi:hypothetical protein